MVGNIFSIEEFSTFDGPGIRCTIFLKGCPMRCQWCHNPEGQQSSPQILRASAGCIQCGNCKNTGMTEASIPLCPQQLYRICGESISSNALIERISDKIWMLNAADGGITFSGGEPLFQSDFLLECLSLTSGLTHRAVQTSGYCSPSIFQKVIQDVDYMLFDLKLMDSNKHIHYTGVDNASILSNYKALTQSGLPFITRIPLIPTVNDTIENLTATAEFMVSLGVNKLELLPYNQAAGAKYKSIGRTYQTEFNESTQPQVHREIFEAYDIEVKVL